MKAVGGASIGALMSQTSFASSEDQTQPIVLVPADKGSSDEWLKSLTARGEREVFRGEALKFIGMPVGGICAGLVYLGGDGKLWLWDVFNRNSMQKSVTYGGKTFGNSDGSTYVEPWAPKSPLSQGFSIQYKVDGVTSQRTLDKGGGWAEIAFQGQYPLATISYSDPKVPVSVKLESFSPFIPLNVDDSSLPATIMRYTVTNAGTAAAEIELAGWLENVVLAMSSPGDTVERKNDLISDANGQGILLSGHITEIVKQLPPDIVFADFSDGTFNGWTATGTAFGTGPVAIKDLPTYMQDIGATGGYIVTSHQFGQGQKLGDSDDATGTLTSKEFTIERQFITFSSSGGHRPHEAGVRLLIGGHPVLEQTGANTNRLALHSWDVSKHQGQKAQIELFDQARGAWGNVHCKGFVFTDKDAKQPPVARRHDYGTMAIYLIDGGQGVSCVPQSTGSPATAASADRPVAMVKKALVLAPGESATVSFVLSWNFPNVDPVINGPDVTHSYAARFADAGAVAQYVAKNLPRLSGDTMSWVQTWNDSTLPYWFLNRTFSNSCNLATTTSYRFANSQFWAWEGIYSCEGTCTHVWGYAQAMARIFPELERALREKTDYAFALNPKTGVINFRGTHGGIATDGQAGIILRTYREHLMTVDDSFLKNLWPKVKLAMDRLIEQVNDKGLLDGPQHNTLDTAWYGEVAWLSGLYLAALRAAQEMAKITGDAAYAEKCGSLFDKGSNSLVPELFNGEYFYNKVDPNHLDAINSGTGCEVDQLMGQSWAWQVGLGRIFPQKETVTALKSLYRYNFAPDAGHYHEQMKVGRWYAMPGEAGLLVCTFPRPDWDFKKASGKGPLWAALYFNECQSGYEYEAAANMIAEGMLTEGLSVVRAIHDRYAPAKRNPYNEIECGDHYSRAMASYASFISICGFEHRGPDGHIAFAPRLTPEKFKAAFTSAQGWGSYAQESSGSNFQADISIKWGQLAIKTIGLKPTAGFQPRSIGVKLGNALVAAAIVPMDDRIIVQFANQITVRSGERLSLTLS